MRFAILAFVIFSFLGFGGDNINFDAGAPGEMPAGWSAVQTQPGPPAGWIVRRDPAAPSRPNVLSQASRDSGRFDSHIAVFDRVVTRDGDVSVKLRIRPGGRPGTAGVVFRYQDPANYMALAAGAEEHQLELFEVRNGKEQAIPPKNAKTGISGVAHDVRPGVWYLAKVVFRGPRFRVMVGNRLVFEAKNDSAIRRPGKTGVFTSGSTVASFDDFRIDVTR